MKILFNSKFLLHNPDSYAEGRYRIEEFPSQTEEVEGNGEACITLVHSESHLKLVLDACMDHRILAEVYLSPESYQAASSAVGLAVMAAERGDFAVVRPPGHHAKPERADGFCLFNNIAIAAQKLVNEGKKIFILDIDGHHGDGTLGFSIIPIRSCSVPYISNLPIRGPESHMRRVKVMEQDIQ
jgi:acetoin utilization deacetylase AcuC-like enzyme